MINTNSYTAYYIGKNYTGQLTSYVPMVMKVDAHSSAVVKEIVREKSAFDVTIIQKIKKISKIDVDI